MSYRWLDDIPRVVRRALFAALILSVILLVGCTIAAQPTPTNTPPLPTLAASPVQITVRGTNTPEAASIPETNPTATPAPTYTDEPETSEESPGLTPTLRRTSTATPVPTGIRPSEATYHRPPELGPESTVEWRPPPVSVPHSLHPDDHYWLGRPLPSDRRNYEIEVYPYGNKPVPLRLRQYRVHHGMDFPNEKGTPIFAASSGTVVFAGPRPNPFSGINYYGNTVIILHDWQWLGEDVYTLYAHTLELFVEVGDVVELGQLIAGVGDSGEVSGPHLHFEVRVGSNHYDLTVNPGLWLAPFEGWGTLAGRFTDNRGRAIHGAHVTLRPESVNSEVGANIQRHLTYAPARINGDASWDENFLFSDLPAGEYNLEFRTSGHVYKRTVTVRPEITNFIVVQADITWSPTATPTFTPTPYPTPTGSPTPTPTATAES
jgi:murein DD-endopeptidase MepM/ murein hydrolase activator NlpD